MQKAEFPQVIKLYTSTVKSDRKKVQERLCILRCTTNEKLKPYCFEICGALESAKNSPNIWIHV